MAEIPLFPLPVVLFPGGRLSLQIVETRYLDMVKQCMKDIFDQKRQDALGSLEVKYDAACSHIDDGRSEFGGDQAGHSEALEKHHKQVLEIDKSIKKMDVSFKLKLECISIEMTGNKSDYYGNSKLMSFGLEK